MREECTCKANQICETCCPEYFEGSNYECGLFHGLKQAVHRLGDFIRDLKEMDDEDEFYYKEIKELERVHSILWKMKNDQKERLPDGYNETY